MKIIFNLIVLFVGLNAVYAQTTPPGIPYQAIARNANGTPYVNANLTVRFSLHEQTATGTVSYSETNNLQTNDLGLFSTTFGSGTPTTGTFAGINWAQTTKFLQVEINLGSAWVDMGTQQLMSVPYAMYAGSVQNNSAKNIADWKLPDGFLNISMVNWSLATSTGNISYISTPYTVPSGKNLYLRSVTSSYAYQECNPGVYCNGIKINTAVCGGSTTNQIYILPQGSEIGFNGGCFPANACGPFAYMSGFLVDAGVTAVFQTSPIIVPAGQIFVVYSTASIPSFYTESQTVPANTNGYLISVQ
jgi:hypothetical protein